MTRRSGLDRWFPPGVAFVLSTIVPNLFFPPLVVWSTIHYILPIWTQTRFLDFLVGRSWISRLTRVTLYLSSPFILPIISGYRSSLRKKKDAARLGAVPVPPFVGKWPGNIDLLVYVLSKWDDDYLGEPFRELAAKYGKTMNLRLLWDDQIYTTNPDHIKAILATDFPNYVKGKKFITRFQSVLGSGVFNSDGEMWKFHRAMARPYFNRDRISDFDIFDRHCDETIQLMKERFGTDSAIDFQDLIARFTLDSATSFLFGASFHSLSAPLPFPYNSNQSPPSSSSTSDPLKHQNSNAFAQAFMTAQITAVRRSRIGKPWPFVEFWKDKTKDAMDTIYEHIEPVLDEALRKKGENGKEREEEKDTFLDHLVELTDDKMLILDAIVNMLVAGRDTTSSMLTFITYMLSTHPEVLARLRQEILQSIGSSQRPTYDTLKELKYLRAVINETLRLFPPVPFNVRESVNSTTWKEPDGTLYYIPPKTNTTYSVWQMQRDPEYWGPDSHIFDPDRWLDSRNKTYVLANPFIFLPFNAGPRICLGQQFAYNETSFFLVRLLQIFDDISLAPEAHVPSTLPPLSWSGSPGRKGLEKIVPRAHLTLYSNGGLWVRMKEAETAET